MQKTIKTSKKQSLYLESAVFTVTFGQHVQNEIKLKKKIIKSHKRKSRTGQGFWQIAEEALYLQFIKRFKRTFQDKKSIRKHKIYQKMSQSIYTRTTKQCTSHHQKMISKYGTIEGVIEFLKQFTGKKAASDQISIVSNQFSQEVVQSDFKQQRLLNIKQTTLIDKTDQNSSQFQESISFKNFSQTRNEKVAQKQFFHIENFQIYFD